MGVRAGEVVAYDFIYCKKTRGESIRKRPLTANLQVNSGECQQHISNWFYSVCDAETAQNTFSRAGVNSRTFPKFVRQDVDTLQHPMEYTQRLGEKVGGPPVVTNLPLFGTLHLFF